MHHSHRSQCPSCHQPRLSTAFLSVTDLHPSIQRLLAEDRQDLLNKSICLYCIQDLRRKYIDELLRKEKNSLGILEEEVVSSLKAGESISENVNTLAQDTLTLGERLADRIASFGGSWTFIILFGASLGCWILLNLKLGDRSFDPFPFILLNLILSCLAAIQAPVIMMSQNRQESKDRIRGEHDYQVNLKAELEIRELHLKIDRLMTNHWESLLEIQQAQIEILNEQTKLLLEEKNRR